jgi:methyl-accepting chemotaxis protein
MKSITLGKRVAFGFAAVIAVTLTLGGVAFSRFLAVSSAGEYLATDPVPGTIAIIDISGAFKENFGLVEKHINARDKNAVAASIQKNKEHIDQLLIHYEATITSEEDRALFTAFKAARVVFVTEFKAVMELNSQGRTNEAIDAAETRMAPAYQKLDDAVERIVEFNKSNIHRGVAAIESSSRGGKHTILIGLGVAMLSAVLIAFFIVRSTTRVLTAVVDTLDAGSAQIASAAGQVSAASQTLAEGASEQAASLEETSASLEEMASMTKRNDESAQQAKLSAGQARASADVGAQQMQAMQNAMSEIQKASTDISKILKTIDEIAFQTNILALNAAVEAARAGNAGAGFAVVADEVRALAQRCAAAAKETALKIDDSVAKSQQGALISADVAKSFTTIQERIRELDTLVVEIATASREQSQGIGQVSTAVAEMDKVTQSNAASAEESASASEELNSQAGSLKEAVSTLQQLVGGTHRATSTATDHGSVSSDVAPGASDAAEATPPKAPARRAVARSAPNKRKNLHLASRANGHADAHFRDL